MLTSIVMTIICIVSMAGMIASENMSQPVKENSILRIKLQGTINEKGEDTNPLELLSGDEVQQIALDEALDALKKAAKNDKVKGIYLEGGILSATPAELQELRQGLVEFKKSGKWIVSYADQYTRGAYYLCSTADKVYMNPQGLLDWSGMASQPIFFKGLLEKVGVKMQVFKVGTYKSAVEPYICDQMSDANREQVTSFLGSIWGNMLKDVAKIELGGQQYTVSMKNNNIPSVMGMVQQIAGSNANEIAKQVKAELEEQAKLFPPGMIYKINYDVTEFLYASIEEVVFTLVFTLILVFLVIYVFLQDWRSTLIPLIAVPVSLIGTFFFLNVMGFSINLLTLSALLLAIAIVVDDAVVVVEAVHAKLDQGYKSSLTASIDAMNEISGAIISITLVMASSVALRVRSTVSSV